MKRIALAVMACALVATTTPQAFAQTDRGHDQPSSQWKAHSEWRKGAKIQTEDWGRGRPVDYRANHLRKPPRGHEWRDVDGNYVMAAAATGVIASVIAHHR